MQVSEYFHVMSTIQVWGMLYLLFISFVKPPIRVSDSFIDTWRKYVGVLHSLVGFTIFVVLPIWAILMGWVKGKAIRSSIFSSSIVLYPWSQFILLIAWVPFEINKYFFSGLVQYQNYLEIAKQKQESGKTSW